jgi:hypothetical protein
MQANVKTPKFISYSTIYAPLIPPSLPVPQGAGASHAMPPIIPPNYIAMKTQFHYKI